MRKHFEFYWPILNVLGIVLVLWSLTIINVNPDHNSKREALLDSTDHDQIFEAEIKERILFDHRNLNEMPYPMVKKNAKLVINF